MVCVSCGRATKTGARFCGGCGASLAQRCPACGAEADPDTRFCETCGASLRARPADAAVERKVVTVVFADLIGSTGLHERLDPESVSRIMEDYHRSVRAPVEAHGGTVVQLLGDGVMCAFGVPRVAEDDALRAVRAAVDVQRSFREFLREHGELAGRAGLRVAVNTGEVVVSDDYAAGIGDPLNVAARLQQEAKDGDVLLGEATQRLVAERVTLARVGSFAIKGRAEPVTAYRVVSLERPAGAAAAPFVGRDDELRRLGAVYEAAVSAPAARLAVLLGSPGLGKSRLLGEFAQEFEGRASVLTAQCNPAGGATFAPLAEALRVHLKLEAGLGDEAVRAAIDARVPGDDAERARIASGIGALLAGTPASPEETFFVVRRLLSALAAEQPVVLAIDDLHWAEPLLLDFTEHLVQWGAGVPLLVLAAARPELRDMRSSFTTPGGLISDVVTLGGLDATAAMRLAANVIGADTLPATVAGRVLTTSEGNPLFLRELVRMLVSDGALRTEGDRWTLAVDLTKLEMPPTIQALLAARIERLRPEERLVLERAAVVGRQFSRAAVTHLLPREAHADLDARLEALRRSELIEPDAGWLLGEPALRFHHVLIRDAAYRRVLRNTRAELHTRFADWLEARTGESVEHDETIGWHLEQAHQHLRELGPLDANGRALGERAARDLAAAGRRALARDDLEPAGNLLGRALACLDDADPGRAELALDWCEALLAAGDVARGAQAVAELGRFTSGSERLRAWHTCFNGQLSALADPQALRASAGAVAAAAEVLASAGDVAGESKAHAVHADALVRLGMIGACEAALDKALAAARRVGDRRRANAVLAGVPLAVLWGPSPVTRASGRCLDVVRVLRITQGAPAVEAVALRCQAVLETLRGRSEAARRMIASSRRLVEELGITQRLLEADMFGGLIELLEGDAVGAERCLRPAYEGFRAHGLGVDAARAAALLGRALLAQDRATEAEALSHESEALAGDDFKAAIAWRGVRAEALARRGEHAAAVELARAAVDIASATDDLLDHADARSALAAALRAAGRSHEADAEDARAIDLWEQKGATLLAERARHVAGRGPKPSVGRVDPVTPARRRVRENAASANTVRIGAALAAGDVGALDGLLAPEVEIVHRPTGSVFDRAECLEGYRGIGDADGLRCEVELLATLGDALSLSRITVSWRSGELLELVLNEVDASGRRRRAEVFAADRIGDAVVRLYERYAELLPVGPERTRAAATARSVATVLGEIELDRYAAAFAPVVEFADHRPLGFPPTSGAEAYLRRRRTLLELADSISLCTDDVLGLRSDALVVRSSTFGTDRVGGGAFERHLLVLWVFGADGLVTRTERFDPDRDVEALARFDELTAGPPTARSVRRRVRPNAATANAARTDAAIAARDTDVLPTLVADSCEVVDHPTGATFDGQGVLATWRILLRARGPTLRHEPLATLGDSLALCRISWSGSSFAGRKFDVGVYDTEKLALIEVDADGRRRRGESFAADHLGDAVARLYERYAELLPDSPARTLAAATARSVAALPLQESGVPGRIATAFAPGIQWDDPRAAGFGSLYGPEAVRRGMDAMLELVETSAIRVDDIVALRSDALLVLWTRSGIDRTGGGAVELHRLHLWVFGADGLVTRWVLLDPGREDEALAHLDELTTEPPAARPIRRRVRANGGTLHADRLNAAIAARDAEAVGSLMSDGMHAVLHQTGSVLDRQETLGWWRLFFDEDRDGRFQVEPVAALGDSLALCRQSWTGTASADTVFDVGPYQSDAFALIDGDAQGRIERSEVFAPDRLGDAIARLYERSGERLPDGPARDRAAATARSVATMLGSFDLDRRSTAFAPTIEFLDDRTVGLGPVSGADAVLRAFRALRELTESWALRVRDVLGVRSDALLVRWTDFGTLRASGGAYERDLLQLWVFGENGLIERWEQLDGEQDVEALARFDELTGDAQESPFENAASRGLRRLERCWHARDWEGVVATFGPEYRLRDRRSVIGLDLDGEEALASVRMSFAVESGRWSSELVATRGRRLALFRRRFRAEGIGDVGAFETGERLSLVETDDAGRRVLQVHFDPDDLDSAYAELDARYVAGEAAPHARSWEAFQRLATEFTTRDWTAIRRLVAPDFVLQDHRLLGRGENTADETRGYVQVLVELAADARLRNDHVLALDDRRTLAVARWVGSQGGGPFEIPFVAVAALDAGGQLCVIELYDLDQLDAARARYAELAAMPPTPWIENAATRNVDRIQAAWAARDWERVAAELAPEFHASDRRAAAHLELDRDENLAFMRMNFELASSQQSYEVLATRGEQLALARMRVHGRAARDAGPSEIEFLMLVEVKDQGERTAVVRFDPDALDAGYTELDLRYAAGEAAPFVAVAAGGRAFIAAATARDWESLTTILAPDLVVHDHRRLGWETLHGPALLVDTWKALVDLSPDVRVRLDHAQVSDNGSLAVLTLLGTHEGGAFEDPRVVVHEYDRNGKIRQHDIYGIDQIGEARARFDEIAVSGPRDPLAALVRANAASAAVDRLQAAFEARDWAAVRRLAAEGARFEDRRRHARVSGDVDGWLADLELVAEAPEAPDDLHFRRGLVATAGDRICLERVLWTGGLWLAEVDDTGRLVAGVLFDMDDRRGAQREALARLIAADPAAVEALTPSLELLEGYNDHDLARMRAVLADDLVYEDRTRAGVGRLEGVAAHLESVAAIWGLVRDVRIETLSLPSVERHGTVATGRHVGTLADGGDFEMLWAAVTVVAGGRITRLEFVEIDHLDAALARLAELRPDPA